MSEVPSFSSQIHNLNGVCRGVDQSVGRWRHVPPSRSLLALNAASVIVPARPTPRKGWICFFQFGESIRNRFRDPRAPQRFIPRRAAYIHFLLPFQDKTARIHHIRRRTTIYFARVTATLESLIWRKRNLLRAAAGGCKKRRANLK